MNPAGAPTAPNPPTAAPYAGDLDAYRAALASFLAGDAARLWRDNHWPTVEETVAAQARLLRVLHDAGWVRYGWPTSVGGLGGDEHHRAVLYDELSAAGIDIPEQLLTLETLGPPMVRFAPALGAANIPGYLCGEQWFGQCFSEPEAGSDLASLRCRAEATGDGGYRINGQKIWTSHGATAHKLVVLVRTGTPESRHRGLSMVLVDADAPGVTVRPLALANGRRELAEIFFDDVAIPASALIGAENQGWEVAMYLLQFERGMYAWLRSTFLLRRLAALARRCADAGMTGELAQRVLGDAYLDVAALRSRSAGTVRRLAAGETVGPEASADKILLATAEQSVHDAARELLSPGLELDDDPELARWRADWWYSRTTSIYGGSAEVQRGIIADRVLQLPKGV